MGNCKYCKKETKYDKVYCNRECYVNDRSVILKCEGCGNEFKVPKNKSHRIYCNKLCSNSNIDRKLTRKKSIETLKLRYNTTNPFEVKGYENLNIDQKSKGLKIKEIYQNKPEDEKQSISKKRQNTINHKSEEEKQLIINKIKNTNIKRYGFSSAFSGGSPSRLNVDKSQRKNFTKNLNIWLEENNLKLLDEFKGCKTKTGELIYYRFQHPPSSDIFIDHLANGKLPIYKDPKSTQWISSSEKEVQEFIKQSLPDIEVITNSRHLIKGFEIDIYIPSLNLAIEFNGLLWHSELKGKTREYHLSKTEECLNKGIHLIHIFEDEWRFKKEIVKSRLLNLIGKTSHKLYARKCEIREINNSEKNQFLNDNHIQGEDKSAIKLGLYYNNELVSLMTFGKLRKITGNTHKEGHYELLRFCNKLNTNVIGGFSKIMKFFIKNYSPKEVLSYADRRYSLGYLYEKNGFTFVGNTPPNYWYLKYFKTREHRFKYRKSELKKLLENFNPELSEWENMKNNKFTRIWDCGSKKYKITFPQ
jgi:hypothetical protein